MTNFTILQTISTIPYPTMLKKWQDELTTSASHDKIADLSRFFKTAPGEYAEGDRFIGLSVPDNRRISKKYFHADLPTITAMLDSEIHEFRLAGFLALVERYHKAEAKDRQAIAKFYLDNCHKANNWDLVDLSAQYIIGEELLRGRSFDNIMRLAASTLLWHRRVAVVSTLMPVRKCRLDEAFEMCHRLISDTEPLMHKAVGWVLRECGKKDRRRLELFLDQHIDSISATTLSYATEHFSPAEREYWRTSRKASKSR